MTTKPKAQVRTWHFWHKDTYIIYWNDKEKLEMLKMIKKYEDLQRHSDSLIVFSLWFRVLSRLFDWGLRLQGYCFSVWNAG